VFQGWDNYFFMLGSAGAGLIGLLFVVVTLTAGVDRSRAQRGAALYLMPTALHFAVVLAISAVAVAPSLPFQASAVIIGLLSAAGLAGAIRSSLGISKPTPFGEPPHWSDFWAYGAGPAVIYAGLCAGSIGLGFKTAWSVDTLAGLILVLLLVGIRNAWDLITTLANRPPQPPPTG
jgi:hypothetical protein